VRLGQDAGGFFFASDTNGSNVRFLTKNGALNEWVRISAGNAGLGTTAPSQKLEVAGNVKISGSGNALVFPDGTVMTSASSGTNGGTITGVAAGAGLTGGGTAGERWTSGRLDCSPDFGPNSFVSQQNIAGILR
jgi:hypothetical protein